MTKRTVCILLVALAGGLAACSGSSSSTKEDDPNVFPAEYKKEILSALSTALDDPTNIRDAFISEPALVSTSGGQRYAVCVRYNARDLARRYVGSTDRIVYFYGGHLNQLVDATPEQCGKANYQRFPELEKLCLAAKCA
jgi:hypothetical protein